MWSHQQRSTACWLVWMLNIHMTCVLEVGTASKQVVFPWDHLQSFSSMSQRIPLAFLIACPMRDLWVLAGDFPWCLCFLPLAPSSPYQKYIYLFSEAHRITSIYQIKTVIKDNKINIQTKSADTSTILDDMDVSKNSGTPKWMVYNGKPY